MYEINAFQTIKNQKRVEQVDNSIRPIYKAIKSMLYAHDRIGQTITGRNWEKVMRLLTLPLRQ